MKKIKIWLNKNYKKLLCAITCGVIAFSCFVGFSKPKSTSAATGDTIRFMKNYFDQTYFNSSINQVFNISNVYISSVNDFSFGWFTTQDFRTNRQYVYQQKNNVVDLAFMRVAQNYDGIVISSDFSTTTYTVTYNNVLLPFTLPYDSVTSTLNMRKTTFNDCVNEFLKDKYLYLNKLNGNISFTYYGFSLRLPKSNSLGMPDYYYFDYNTGNGTGKLQTLSVLLNNQLLTLDSSYFENISVYNISDFVNDNVDLGTLGAKGFFILPYLSIEVSSHGGIPLEFYLVQSNDGSKIRKFYDYDFYNSLSSLFTYGNTEYDLSKIYYSGYQKGYDDGFGSESPIDVIFGTVKSFFNFEILPDFKIYYFLLMALGISLFGVILKYAFGG